MHTQKVQNPPLKAIQGIGVVAGVVAALFLGSVLAALLTPLIGSTLASVAFWALGIAVALWVMRRFVLTYTYDLGPNLLRISFSYGRYQRDMADIYFNNILNAGDLQDMRARYPNARVNRAVRPGCPLEPLAVACKDAIYLLQPDPEIRQVLEAHARKNRK